MQSIIDDIDTTSLASNAKIKVVGVGGGGGNAVQKMISSDLCGGYSLFVPILTVAGIEQHQCARKNPAWRKADPWSGELAPILKLGVNSAIESQNAIRDAIGERYRYGIHHSRHGVEPEPAPAPGIASIAKEMGALTVGGGYKTFTFEGTKAAPFAEAGIEEFKKFVDSGELLFPNDGFNSIAAKKGPLIPHPCFKKQMKSCWMP